MNTKELIMSMEEDDHEKKNAEHYKDVLHIGDMVNWQPIFKEWMLPLLAQVSFRGDDIEEQGDVYDKITVAVVNSQLEDKHCLFARTNFAAPKDFIRDEWGNLRSLNGVEDIANSISNSFRCMDLNLSYWNNKYLKDIMIPSVFLTGFVDIPKHREFRTVFYGGELRAISRYFYEEDVSCSQEHVDIIVDWFNKKPKCLEYSKDMNIDFYINPITDKPVVIEVNPPINVDLCLFNDIGIVGILKSKELLVRI